MAKKRCKHKGNLIKGKIVCIYCKQVFIHILEDKWIDWAKKYQHGDWIEGVNKTSK